MYRATPEIVPNRFQLLHANTQESQVRQHFPVIDVEENGVLPLLSVF